MRLAAPPLHLVAGEHDGLAAELAHGDVEGHPGPGRRAGRRSWRASRPASGRSARARAAVGLQPPALVEDRPQRSGRRYRRDRGNAGPSASAAGALAGSSAASAASKRRTPSSSSASVTLSGGRRRMTFSPAATPSMSWSRSAASTSPTGTLQRTPIEQPLAADLVDEVGMGIDHRGEPLLEVEALALRRPRGSRRRGSRRARPGRPPWPAGCRRRSSRGCRASCPWPPPRWRGRRRAGSRRRCPWPRS